MLSMPVLLLHRSRSPVDKANLLARHTSHVACCTYLRTRPVIPTKLLVLVGRGLDVPIVYSYIANEGPHRNVMCAAPKRKRKRKRNQT